MYDNNDLMEKLKVVSSDIRASKLSPYYFLYGQEDFFINSIYNSICKAFDDKTGLNTIIYDEDNFNIDNAIKTIVNVPMMNDKKLIIFKNCPIFKQKIENDKNVNDLINAFKKSCDINIIIVIMNEIDKKNSGKKYTEFGKSNKFIDFFNENGVCLNLSKVNDEDIGKYVYNHIRKAGVEIDKPELMLFINNCGKNINNLYNEADKLISYIGDKKKITKEDILAVSSRNIEESVYKLIDLFNDNRTSEAYKIYGDLLSEGINEFTIFIYLYNNYEKLLLVKDLCERGKNIREIAEILNIKDWQVKNFIKAGNAYSKVILKDKLAKVTKLNDEYMKGNINDSLMTELLLY